MAAEYVDSHCWEYRYTMSSDIICYQLMVETTWYLDYCVVFYSNHALQPSPDGLLADRRRHSHEHTGPGTSDSHCPSAPVSQITVVPLSLVYSCFPHLCHSSVVRYAYQTNGGFVVIARRKLLNLNVNVNVACEMFYYRESGAWEPAIGYIQSTKLCMECS